VRQPDLFHRLEELYKGEVMNIDLFVGGMLESYGSPGPLFNKIIREQFQRLRYTSIS
jgi:dual oxidase